MCATTLIELEMPGKDPTRFLPTRAVFEYIQLWLSLDNDLRGRIANAWESTRSAIVDVEGKPVRNKIQSPIAAIIAVLLDLQRQPVSSTLWIDPQGTSWELSDHPADLRLFTEHLLKLSTDAAWLRLAGGHLTEGINGAIDLQPARALLKRFVKQGEHMRANILRRIITAGIWTSSRKASVGMAVAPICPL